MHDSSTISGEPGPEDALFAAAIYKYETALDEGQPLSREEIARLFPALRMERFDDYLKRRQTVAQVVSGPRRPEFVALQDFSHYRIGEVVGWGGNASIHSVEDQRFSRTAALKVPLKERSRNAVLLHRLEREARLSGRLQHPHILPVYDMGRTSTSDGELPYFTMRLVNGKSLAQVLSNRANPAENQFEHLLLFRQVCEAVAYAHDQGIIHSDLKPGNVMVGTFADAYVTDWGCAIDLNLNRTEVVAPSSPSDLAAFAEAHARDPHKTPLWVPREGGDSDGNAIHGTPAYLPPEIAQYGINRADQRSDVFGLGGILCVILTGTPVYVGDHQIALSLSLKGDLHDTFARLDQSRASADMISLAKSCLAPDPNNRPSNAGDVAHEMKAYIERQEQAKLEAERQIAIAAQARADAEADARRDAEGRTSAERRAKRLTAGLATCLVMMAVAGGVFVRNSYERANELRRFEALRDFNRFFDIASNVRSEAESSKLDSLPDLEKAIAIWNRNSAVLAQARTAAKLAESSESDLQKIDQLRDEATHREAVLRRWTRLLTGLRDSAERTTTIIDRETPRRAIIRKSLMDTFADFGIPLARGHEQEIAELFKPMPSALRRQASNCLDCCEIIAPGNDDELNWGDTATLILGPEGSWRPSSDMWPDLTDDKIQAMLSEAGEDAPGSGLLWMLLLMRPRQSSDAVLIAESARKNFRDEYFVHVLAAGAHENARDYPMAIESLRAALAVSPRSPWALAAMGELYRKNGNYDEAEWWLQKALEIEPNHPWALCNLGIIRLTVRGIVRDAVELFEKSLRIFPSYPYAADGLSLAYAMQGNWTKAMSVHKSVGLDPANSPVYLFADVFRNVTTGGLRRASSILQRMREHPVVRDNQDSRDLLELFSLVLDMNVEEVKAKVIELSDGKRTPTVRYLAIAVSGIEQMAAGQFAEAEATFRESLSVVPGNLAGNIGLVTACRQQGKLEEATRAVAELKAATAAIIPGSFGNITVDTYMMLQDVALGPADRILEPNSPDEVLERAAKDWWGALAGPVADLAVARGRSAIAVVIYTGLFGQGGFTEDFLGGVSGVLPLMNGIPSNRLNGARAIALVMAGKDVDGRTFNDAQTIKFAEIAWRWLAADLKSFRNQARSSPEKFRARIWCHFVTNCPDLAGVRDAEYISQLPGEWQEKWNQLWADVRRFSQEIKRDEELPAEKTEANSQGA